VRARHVPYIVGLAALGCGNGVGRPIVERDLVNAGASAASGASGTGGAGAAGRSWQENTGGVAGRDTSVGGTGRDDRPWDDEPWDDRPPEGSCPGTENWPPEIAYGEQALLDSINALRTSGFDCDTGGPAEPVAPVAMKAELQCAARRHARDMTEREFFDHVNPDGVGPEDRIRRTGYEFRVAGEVIVREDDRDGSVPFPFEAFDALLAAGSSDCRNLVDSRFDAVGIGHFAEFWTIDLTGP
jgi:hypothetical protein